MQGVDPLETKSKDNAGGVVNQRHHNPQIELLGKYNHEKEKNDRTKEHERRDVDSKKRTLTAEARDSGPTFSLRVDNIEQERNLGRGQE